MSDPRKASRTSLPARPCENCAKRSRSHKRNWLADLIAPSRQFHRSRNGAIFILSTFTQYVEAIDGELVHFTVRFPEGDVQVVPFKAKQDDVESKAQPDS